MANDMTVVKLSEKLVADVAGHRRRTLDALIALVARATNESEWDIGSGSLNVRYAVAHHVAHLVRDAAGRHREGQRATSDIVARWNTRSALANTGGAGMSAVVARVEDAMQVSSLAADDKVWLLLPESSGLVPVTLTAIVDKAMEFVRAGGFAELVAEGAAVVMLLRERGVGMDTFSWTISSIPSTIFVDYAIEPARLAEDLVHESCHAWLNDCLRARRASVALEPLYYSPWKGQLRSAFGLLHTAFAFGAVAAYCKWFLAEHGRCADPGVAQYFEKRLVGEMRRAAQCRGALEEVIRAVEDPDIRGMVEGVFVHLVEGP